MGAKNNLYKFIADFKMQWNLPLIQTKHTRQLCEEDLGILLGDMDFLTHGLRGMATPATYDKAPVIILNEQRNRKEQHFDCAHEMIHLFKHSNKKVTSFSCYDKVRPNQNVFLEWEANEGAAEFLMPYSDFIPRLKIAIFDLNYNCTYADEDPITQLSNFYKLSDVVIENRIRNLMYETLQYLSGIDIEQIDIKSRNEQKSMGIKSSDYKIDLMYKNYLQQYCTK